MVMNKNKGILYAAFPELGTIAAVNAESGDHFASINTFRSRSGGPGRIVLEVDDIQDRLFVYVPDTQKLSVYNGHTLEVIKQVQVDIERMENSLTFNRETNVLYAGNRILDSQTLSKIGTFEKGDFVVGIDTVKKHVYLKNFKSIGRGRHQETIYKYQIYSPGSGPLGQWTLSPVYSIPSSVVIDEALNRFYVGYFESANVEAFALDGWNTSPSEQGQSSSGNNGND
jgi:hypothetical protein